MKCFREIAWLDSKSNPGSCSPKIGLCVSLSQGGQGLGVWGWGAGQAQVSQFGDVKAKGPLLQASHAQVRMPTILKTEHSKGV